MEYFAGLFDAEGSISLFKNGAFPISLEMANELIPNLFKERFGGSIYTRQRINRKRTWCWKINSKASEALNFLDALLPLSHLKKEEMQYLREYLMFSKKDRGEYRKSFSERISSAKIPLPVSIKEIKRIFPKASTESFGKWLAGFIDGDGNFVCNQYKDNRNGKYYWGRQISVSNIHGITISYINDHIPGCITLMKRPVHPIYKWTCKRGLEQIVCGLIFPHLKIKKRQCEIFSEFLIPDIGDEQRRDLVTDLKFCNSL